MVSEALRAMFKARGLRPFKPQEDKHDTQTLREERKRECLRTLIFAQDTPWDWPDVDMHNHEKVVEVLNASKVSKTLANLRLFGQAVDPLDVLTSIWDFKRKEWVKWEPEKDKAAFGEMLLQCAKELLKVIYFCNHDGDFDALYDHIPGDFVAHVFTEKEWSQKIHSMVSRMQKRTFATVLDSILPRWQADDKFPTPFDPKLYNPEVRSHQFDYFMQKALSDPIASAQFYRQLGSSVNWMRIRMERTEEKVAYEWGIKSMASAVEIAYRLGYGGAVNAMDYDAWKAQFVAMAKDKSRPSYEAILLREEFGQEHRINNLSRASKKAEKRAINAVDKELVPSQPGEPALQVQKLRGMNNAQQEHKAANEKGAG